MTTPVDPVSRILSRPLIEVNMDENLDEIAEIMIENDVGVALVRGPGGPVGIVSERDLVRSMAEEVGEEGDRAFQIMTFDMVTVAPNDSIETAARLMTDGGIRHVPVIEGNTALGVISMRDVLNVYLTVEHQT